MNELLLTLRFNVSEALNGLNTARQAFTDFAKGPLRQTNDAINDLRAQNREYGRSLASLKKFIDRAEAARIKEGRTLKELKNRQRDLTESRKHEEDILKQLTSRFKLLRESRDELLKGEVTAKSAAQADRLSEAMKRTGQQITSTRVTLHNYDSALLENRQELNASEQQHEELKRTVWDTARQIETLKGKVADNNDRMKDMRVVTKAVTAELRTSNQLLQEYARNTLTNVVTAAGMIRQVASSVRTVGIAFVAIGAAIVASFTGITAAAAETEAGLAALKAVVPELRNGTEQANASFSKLTATLREQAATTIFTIQEVTTAAKALGQAGFQDFEITAAIPATLQLAAAGFIETADAAKTAAEIVRGFQLQASSLIFVVDALAVAQSNSIASIEDMRQAFSFSTAAASAFNQSADTVAQTLAVLANQGIRGTRAGTGLSQILSRLSRDVGKTTEFARKLGLTFSDLDPTTRSLVDIVATLRGTAVSTGDAMKFFGERAGRTLLALVNASQSSFDDIGKAIEEGFGEALIQAAERADTVSGAIDILKSKIADLFQTIGNSVLPDLTEGIRFLGEVVDSVNQFLIQNFGEQGTRILVLMTVAVGGLVAGFGGLIAIVGTVVGVIAGLVATIGSFQLQAFAMKVSLEQAQIQATMASESLLSMAASIGVADSALNVLKKDLLQANAAMATFTKEAQAGTLAVTKGGVFGLMAEQGRKLVGVLTKANNALKSFYATLFSGGAVAALKTFFGTLLTGGFVAVKSAIVGAITALAPFLPLIATVSAALTGLGIVAAATLKAFDPSKNIAAWQTFGGVIHRLKEAILTPFAEGWASLSASMRQLSDLLQDQLSGAFADLATAVQNLVDAALDFVESPFGQELLKLLGIVTKLVAGAGLYLLIRTINLLEDAIKLAEGALRLFNVGLNLLKLRSTSSAAAVGELASQFKQYVSGAEDVVEVTDEMRKSQDEWLTSADGYRRSLSKSMRDFSEYVDLLGNAENLTGDQLERLIALNAEYGDGQPFIDARLASIKAEKEGLQELITTQNMEGEARDDLKLKIDALTQAEELLRQKQEEIAKIGEVRLQDLLVEAKAREALNSVIAEQDAANAALAEAMDKSNKATQRAIEGEKKLEESVLSRIEAQREAVAQETEERIAAAERAAQADFAVWEARYKQYEEAKAAADAYFEANANNADFDEAEQARLDKARADASTVANQAGDTYKASVAEAEAIKLEGAEAEAALRAKAARTQEEFAKQTAKLEEKREIEILNLQGKRHEARLKQIELEYKEAIEAERERFKETGINNEELLKKRLRGIEEVRDAEIKAVKDVMLEEQKKLEEKAKKEKEAAAKKAKMEKSDEEKLMDKALSNLAQRVQSTRELVALNRLLLGLEEAKQRRAREAVRDAMRTQTRVQQAEANAGAAQTPEQAQRFRNQAAKLSVKARLDAMFAGQAVSDAGGSPQFAQMFQSLVGGAGGDGASLGGGNSLLQQLNTGMNQAVAELQAIRVALGGQAPEGAAGLGQAPPPDAMEMFAKAINDNEDFVEFFKPPGATLRLPETIAGLAESFQRRFADAEIGQAVPTGKLIPGGNYLGMPLDPSIEVKRKVNEYTTDTDRIPIDVRELNINLNGVNDPNANAEAVMKAIQNAALSGGP